MAYRHATSRENSADLAGALYSAPGFPAFPVRLADEIFRRALAHTAGSAAHVWDPCCGSAFLLTALALRHRRSIAEVIGTDVDPAALHLARRNLHLLSHDGMAARADELRARGERLDRPHSLAAAAGAQRLARRLAADGGALPRRVAQADVFDPAQLRRALDGRRPDIVITDVPYGEQTRWLGTGSADGVAGMVAALGEVLDDGAVIAVATRGRRVLAPGSPPRVESFRVGTRAVALWRVSHGPTSRGVGDAHPASGPPTFQ